MVYYGLHMPTYCGRLLSVTAYVLRSGYIFVLSLRLGLYSLPVSWGHKLAHLGFSAPGSNGPGSDGPTWALMGRAPTGPVLMRPWALMGQALMGRAPMGPPEPKWAGP